MGENLAEVLQGMSLGEDKSIIIPDEDAYCAMDRGGRSILGRLLNPECQNMGRMLKTMPKIWKVYERVTGIALTKERFQFIFDLETDIQTVLRQGFWTFDDWGMAMERWVEFPPPNNLQTVAIWVRLHNLPTNYFTMKTTDIIADGIGHVDVIEFDPEKPLLNDYVRVQKCPLYQGSRTKGKGIVPRQNMKEGQSSGTRQHHNDLAEKLMPLLAPSVPPGFEPHPTMVAHEVFEQMKIYMSCSDPEERRIREEKMRKTLNELSNDPMAQRSCLRLEMAPTISTEINRDRGRVFDFSKVQERRIPDVSESSSHGMNKGGVFSTVMGEGANTKETDQSQPQKDDGNEIMGRLADTGGFVIGSNSQLSGERSSKSWNSKRSKPSWTRHNQTNRRLSQSGQSQRNGDREVGTVKHKAAEDGEVSSKLSKQSGGLMVHQKPSNPH
ncbi:uncharacterized protein LOC106355563 [Brassica napus]|nr:uncharacterized protein LOC106355563 [Brassica napus]